MRDEDPGESWKISFAHRRQRASVTVYEAGWSALYTQLTCTLPPEWTHRIEVLPPEVESAGRDLERVTQTDAYVVHSDAPAVARAFLDAPALERLRAMGDPPEAAVTVDASRIQVRVRGVLADIDRLRAFVEAALGLVDRVEAALLEAAGVSIVDVGAEASSPVCQVCGTAMAPAETVLCRRCRTPHHAECWSYNGRCSTYACGKRRATGPARPARTQSRR